MGTGRKNTVWNVSEVSLTEPNCLCTPAQIFWCSQKRYQILILADCQHIHLHDDLECTDTSTHDLHLNSQQAGRMSSGWDERRFTCCSIWSKTSDYFNHCWHHEWTCAPWRLFLYITFLLPTVRFNTVLFLLDCLPLWWSRSLRELLPRRL